MARILLVEDEIAISISASMVLEDEGFAVLVAHDGAEGLELAQTEAPDLIISDYMMPRMDGLSMIMALRRISAEPPIILSTSISCDKLPADYAGGHNAFLQKPYRDDDLLQAVRQFVK